ELQSHENHENEHDVGRGAVPDEPPLVPLLALGDALQVGRERVGQVVGFDDEAAGLDDFALELADLFIEFVDHPAPKYRTSPKKGKAPPPPTPKPWRPWRPGGSLQITKG